jgi:hypothetical protein
VSPAAAKHWPKTDIRYKNVTNDTVLWLLLVQLSLPSNPI